MDSECFDALAKALVRRTDRRTLGGILAAVALAAGRGFDQSAVAGSKKKKKGKKKPPPLPPGCRDCGDCEMCQNGACAPDPELDLVRCLESPDDRTASVTSVRTAPASRWRTGRRATTGTSVLTARTAAASRCATSSWSPAATTRASAASPDGARASATGTPARAGESGRLLRRECASTSITIATTAASVAGGASRGKSAGGETANPRVPSHATTTAVTRARRACSSGPAVTTSSAAATATSSLAPSVVTGSRRSADRVVNSDAARRDRSATETPSTTCGCAATGRYAAAVAAPGRPSVTRAVKHRMGKPAALGPAVVAVAAPARTSWLRSAEGVT